MHLHFAQEAKSAIQDAAGVRSSYEKNAMALANRGFNPVTVGLQCGMRQQSEPLRQAIER